jgi:cell division protein FtsW
MLYLAQPDFGSVVVLFLVTFGMGLGAGVRPAHLAICGTIGLMLIFPVILLSPYRMRRVTAFLSPFADPAGKGYQLIQSLIAVGSGGLTGLGIGNSQQKLFFLPAAHTDFIFAVVAEELGFVGCVILLTLFMAFFYRGVRLATFVAHDTFAFSLALGLTLMIVVPAFLNTGVVTGLLPTKGMVLPLIGYGGSSLVATLVGVGILLGVTRKEQGEMHER